MWATEAQFPVSTLSGPGTVSPWVWGGAACIMLKVLKTLWTDPQAIPLLRNL